MIPAAVTAISFCRFLGFALHGRLTIFAVNALRSASEIIEMLS
jgi:hypothetical protein